MVPGNYLTGDSEEVLQFCDLEGSRGRPLLARADLFDEVPRRAQERLQMRIEQNETDFLQLYSREKTAAEFGPAVNAFRIHGEKCLDAMVCYLMSKELAWWDSTVQDSAPWFAVHPQLGNAIMSTLAIAVARNEGLDIVTDSSSVHHVVASRKEEDVFQELLRKEPEPIVPSPTDNVEDLAEVVITTAFDVSSLTPKQIADLVKNGRDLRRFKKNLAEFVRSISPMTSTKERRLHLEERGQEVLKDWQQYRKELPTFALNALVGATSISLPALVEKDLAGAVNYTQLVAGGGRATVLLAYSGYKVWRKYGEDISSPYEYLSQIRQAQTALTLPPLPSMLPS